MARSLDNTLRVVQLKSTEWIICDIRIHAVVGGYAHGTAFLWSEDGELLAIASQSIGVRLRPDNGRRSELERGRTGSEGHTATRFAPNPDPTRLRSNQTLERDGPGIDALRPADCPS